MVTAKLIAGQSVPLDLPMAATAGATETVFAVAVDAQHRVTANGKPVADRAALQAEAKLAYADNSELRVLVSAEKASSHGSVMQVVDSLRQIGITRIAFAADAGEPSPHFGD
jgi:biopolymer transport protein ExbD